MGRSYAEIKRDVAHNLGRLGIQRKHLVLSMPGNAGSRIFNYADNSTGQNNGAMFKKGSLNFTSANLSNHIELSGEKDWSMAPGTFEVIFRANSTGSFSSGSSGLGGLISCNKYSSGWLLGYINGTTGQMQLWQGGNDRTAGFLAWPVGEYNHLHVTIDEDNLISFYSHGKKIYSIAGGTSFTPGTVAIGCGRDSTGATGENYWFDGAIYCVNLYNGVVLPDETIARQAAEGLSLYKPHTNPIYFDQASTGLLPINITGTIAASGTITRRRSYKRSIGGAM